LGKLCTLFGVTRQAYYEAEIQENKTSIARMVVLSIVKELREDIPLIGTRKLLFKLDPYLIEHGIKMGRDQLFNLLRFHGLLIRRRKRIVKTTDSHHWLKKYPNLIKEMVITSPEQLWVSDITYIRTLVQKPAKVSTSDRRKVSTHFTGEDFVILLAKGH